MRLALLATRSSGQLSLQSMMPTQLILFSGRKGGGGCNVGALPHYKSRSDTVVGLTHAQHFGVGLDRRQPQPSAPLSKGQIHLHSTDATSPCRVRAIASIMSPDQCLGWPPI